jgi:hypothetical protein
MKSYIKSVFFLSILLFSLDSFGQRWKTDPTYSPNNYKHPNKATIARNADTARLKDIQYVHALVPVTNNYKAQNLIIMREPKKVQVISVADRNKAVTRNYKQQFAPTTKKKK